MCNVHEGETQLPPKVESISISRKCMKCDTRAVAVARTKDPFCKDCFNAYFTHRFRATFGKSRLIRAGEKVLLAFSGGLNSRVMLALVEEGLSERVYKKLRFIPSVIVIDEGAVLSQSWSVRCHSQAEVLSIAAQSGFPVYCTQLEQLFGSYEAKNLEDLFSCSAGERGAGVGGTVSFNSATVGDSAAKHPVSADDPKQTHRIHSPDYRHPSRADKNEEQELPFSCTANNFTDVEVHRKEKTLSQDSTPQPRLPSSPSSYGASPSGPTSNGKLNKGPAIDEISAMAVTMKISSDAQTVFPGLPTTSQSPAGASSSIPLSASASALEIAQKLMSSTREESLEVQLKDLFQAMKSMTAKENLLLSLRHQLLVELARKYGFTKVLVGDSATRLAVRLLGNIAQGRGGTLPLDTGFADDRVKDVVFVRPMREFPSREIAAYIALHNLQTVTIPTLSTRAPEKASIERLTESFINGLQAGFPSTVHTVFRIGDKLAVSDDTTAQSKPCCLCQAPCGQMADKSVFAHLKLSETGLPSIGTSEVDSDLSVAQPAESIWESMCYGCQLTVKDMKCDITALPPYIHAEAGKTTRRAKVKAEIKEFLLDDAGDAS